MSSAINTHGRNLAAAMREHRIDLDLTQAEAANELGVSLRSLQAWEAGDTFPRPSHRRLIKAWIATEQSAA